MKKAMRFIGNLRGIGVLALLLAVGLLAACSGRPGDTYLKYYWVATPLYLSDTNPSTPSYVQNNTYFSTETGDFYVEYQAWDTSWWWMDYTISADPGSPILEPGPDSWFEIDLFANGPTLYHHTWALSAEQSRAGSLTRGLGPASATNSEPSASKAPLGESLTQSITSGGYTLTLRYGRLPAK